MLRHTRLAEKVVEGFTYESLKDLLYKLDTEDLHFLWQDLQLHHRFQTPSDKQIREAILRRWMVGLIRTEWIESGLAKLKATKS